VNPDPRNPIVQFLYRSTEPILRPFRRLLPPGRTGGIDFSPLLVILAIIFIRTFLSRLFLRPAGFI
jgi:YggT family protein